MNSDTVSGHTLESLSDHALEKEGGFFSSLSGETSEALLMMINNVSNKLKHTRPQTDPSTATKTVEEEDGVEGDGVRARLPSVLYVTPPPTEPDAAIELLPLDTTIAGGGEAGPEHI